LGSLARLPVTIGLAAAGSLAVETLQHMLALGRVSSIDDVLLNAAGVGVTVQVTRRSWRMHKTAQSRPASAASAAQLAA
jgi:glycopeptide antibiotics resistance protein